MQIDISLLNQCTKVCAVLIWLVYSEQKNTPTHKLETRHYIIHIKLSISITKNPLPQYPAKLINYINKAHNYIKIWSHQHCKKMPNSQHYKKIVSHQDPTKPINIIVCPSYIFLLLDLAYIKSLVVKILHVPLSCINIMKKKKLCVTNVVTCSNSLMHSLCRANLQDSEHIKPYLTMLLNHVKKTTYILKY